MRDVLWLLSPILWAPIVFFVGMMGGARIIDGILSFIDALGL